jgi:hypothetical protein
MGNLDRSHGWALGRGRHGDTLVPYQLGRRSGVRALQSDGNHQRSFAKVGASSDARTFIPVSLGLVLTGGGPINVDDVTCVGNKRLLITGHPGGGCLSGRHACLRTHALGEDRPAGVLEVDIHKIVRCL